MLFNSGEFLVFFPLVAAVHFGLPHRFRWMLLLAASYYFYMSWRPAYAGLLAISTLVDYGCALAMSRARSRAHRRLWLIASLTSNLGLLFTFKYLDLFGWTLAGILRPAAAADLAPILDVALPVGISFYTFQTLSYTIDVYRGVRAPERRLGVFALYVSFFPQLVAGPIERSTTLLPQFDRPASPDVARILAGLRRMLYGMFLKVVVADTLAAVVDPVFAQPGAHAGPAIALATLLFAVQILCDFAGYSEIAIGAALVLGIRLMENFRQPYGAASLREFWQRWHISLSTWFRDYLYLPLGGNRKGRGRAVAAIAIVFLLSGLWHGASWTFALWGLWHALLLLGERRLRPAITRASTRLGLGRLPALRHALAVGTTFLLVCLGWILFRADSFADAVTLLRRLPTGWGAFLRAPGSAPPFDAPAPLLLSACVVLAGGAVRGLCREIGSPILALTESRPRRWSAYYLLLASVLLFFGLHEQAFLYFQF